MNLTGEQKKTIAAAFLGWMLDAFDFFLLTFLLKDIAKEFGVEISAVAYALFLTLAMRFVGAFIFGRLGDRWGRKPALMLDILCYSILGALAAFSPNLIGVPDSAGAVRHRHGRRMGPRQLAGDGVDPAAGARHGVRHSAMRLSDRLSARRARQRPALRPHFRRLHGRLAGDVPAQRPARLRRAVHPQRRARIAGVRGVEGAREAATCGRRFPSTRGWSSTWSC